VNVGRARKAPNVGRASRLNWPQSRWWRSGRAWQGAEPQLGQEFGQVQLLGDQTGESQGGQAPAGHVCELKRERPVCQTAFVCNPSGSPLLAGLLAKTG
jgi:hypothetical protein